MSRAAVSVVTLLVWAPGCGDGIGPLDSAVAFQSVSAGETHTCALDADGAAYCWGLASAGELGDGQTNGRPYAAAVASEARFVALSAGSRHTCAISTDSTLYCWGSNERGQVGTGSTEDQHYPSPVGGSLTFTQVSSGMHHTCGVTAAGETYCWGANEDGQLGDGTTTDRLTPMRVDGPAFTRVRAGGHHTCALTADGSAYCWGLNEQGQLGIGSVVSSARPIALRRDRSYRQIAAGASHTCAIAQNERAFCWGSNGFGELGLHWIGEPGVPGRLRPDEVTTDIPRQTFRSIDAGVDFTCAIDARRHGYCWGRGYEGQLGTGSTRTWEWPRSLYPPPIPRGPRPNTFLNVSTGATHACATTMADAIMCWGTGEWGQLGLPGVWASELPVRVAGVKR